MDGRTIVDQRYQILIESDDLIAISTPERIRKFVNKSYCSFAEKLETELIGQSIFEGFTPQKLELYTALATTLSVNSPKFDMITRSGKPGNEKWVKWSENGIFDSQGNLIEVLSIGRNIDDFIQAKKQSEEVQAVLTAYREAIDSNVICSITDKRGRIIYANQLFCEISGYKAEELVGQSHNIVNSGRHPDVFFKDMWGTILSNKMWHGELCNKAKDGSLYWVKTVIIPIKNTDGELSNFLSLRVLVTERKKLEEERNSHMQSLEEMLHMVSHELRKPITNFLGLLNLAKSNNITEKERAEIIDHLFDSASELDMYSRKMNTYLHTTKHKFNNASSNQ